MTIDRTRTDTVQKNTAVKRSASHGHPFLIFFLILFLMVPGLIAFLIWGGPMVTDMVSWGARKYLSGLEHLNISFESFSGDPLNGYALEKLAVGDVTTPDTLTVGKLTLAINAPESWRQKKLVLSASLDNLRIKESQLQNLADAAAADFPASEKTATEEKKESTFAPLAYVAPQKFSAQDWAGEMGWKLSDFNLERADDEKLIYKTSLNAEYQKEPIALTAKTELTEFAMPLWVDTQLSALGSDVRVQTAFADSRIEVKNIEGSLLSSPLKGTALIDMGKSDPEIAADVDLQKIDFKRLSRWVPGLDGSLDGFAAHVSGSLAHPAGKVTLKNGNVKYQDASVSAINGTVDLNGSAAVLDLSASVLGSQVRASGTAPLTQDGKLDINASVPSFSLASLKQLVPSTEGLLDGTISADVSVTGTIAQPNVAVNVASQKVTVQKNYVFSDIKARVLTDTKSLTIEELSTDVFHGHVECRGTVGLTDKVPSLNLTGDASKIDLSESVPDGTVKGIFNGSFKVSGTTAQPVIDLQSNIDELDAAQFGAKDIALTVSGSDTLDINIEGTTKLGTPFGGGGKVALPLRGKKSNMDLQFVLNEMKLSELFPNTMKFSGEVSLALFVKGSFEKPQISAQMESPELQVNNFKAVEPKVTAELKGDKALFDASLAMGDRRPSIKGTVYLKNGFRCEVDVTAPTVRPDAIEPTLAGVVDGRISLNSHGVIKGSDIVFTGSVTSPRLTAAGVAITNIKIPFSFKDYKVSVPDAVCEIGDGKLHLNADGSVTTGTYNFDLNGKDINLHRVVEPLNLPADVSGMAEVSFTGSARSGITTLVQGDGRINVRALEVNNFPGQTTVMGKDPFRIQTGSMIFNVNDGEVFLMPGSSISAWPDDKVYHFISFTGTAWRKPRATPQLDESMLPKDLLRRSGDMYHMYIDGSINVRVLNGLLGGMGAVIDAGMEGDLSTETIATNFVQNFISGGIVTQFRAFELDVAGKDYSEVRIGKLKFEGSGSYADVDTTSWTEDSSVKSDVKRYTFSYPVPMGRNPAKIKSNSTKTKSQDR